MLTSEARCSIPLVQGGYAHARPQAQTHARSLRASSRMVADVSLWILVSLALLARPAQLQKPPRCARSCSCSKESIICVGISGVPRSPPGDISSL